MTLNSFFASVDLGFRSMRVVFAVPIVSLPPRIIRLQAYGFREEEHDFYKALWGESKTKFNSYIEAGSVLKNYAHILELLLRLRQACNHPYLVLNSKRVAMQDVKNIVQSYLAEVKAGKSSSCYRLVEIMRAWGDEECVVCLEGLEDPIVTFCGHLFCRNCIFRQGVTNLSSNHWVECPTCRTKIKENEWIPLPKNTSEAENLDVHNYTNYNIGNTLSNSSSSSTSSVVERTWKSSTKIDALMKELWCNNERDPTLKSIVFSQWTSMLDLAEIPLKNSGFKYVRLDGSMTQGQREHSIRSFRNDADIKVFLVSMKAGGLGLNLTSASHVFLLDPWWNPATEDQAIDRVHRLGQRRPVVVTRFIIKDSIEERILELQEKKKKVSPRSYDEK